MIITDQTQFNNINSSQIKQQYSIVIWQLHHCHYRVEQQHLCWILLDTNDFNQQTKIFSAMLWWDRDKRDVQPVNIHSPTNSAAAMHQYEKIVDFLTSNVTLTSDCVLMWCHPDLWLCPDVDRQAVKRDCQPPNTVPHQSWIWVIVTFQKNKNLGHQERKPQHI